MSVEHAFGRAIELLRKDEAHDEKLVAFARRMYTRFVEGRTLGDKSLESLFPWSEPDWGLETDLG